MKKIALVNPPLSIAESFGRLSPFANFKIPINLCFLATVLKKNGFTAKIVDCAAEQIGFEEACDRILALEPSVVGLTAFTITINRAIRLASMLKERRPDIITVIGGVHVSALPIGTMEENSCFDIAVLGEGEETVVELMKAIDENGSLEGIKGIVFRAADGSLVTTESRPLIQDLDSIPCPEIDTFLENFRSYQSSLHRRLGGQSIILITSRGCPQRCTFCDRSVLGRRYRHHSIPYVIDMIEYYGKNHGIRNFNIEDENIGVKKAWLSELCETIIRKDLNISWTCSMRADHIDEDIAKLLYGSGCRNITFGIESGSQKMLEVYRKDIDLSKVRNALKILERNRIDVSASFIIGGPGETLETIGETISFIKSTRFRFFYLWYFTPMPGASCYEDIEKHGTMISRNWDDYSVQKVVFLPEGLTREELERSYSNMYKVFYLRPYQVMNQLRDITSPRKLMEKMYLATQFFKAFFAPGKDAKR